MKKYFYTIGVDRKGPFSFDELKNENLTRDTKLWFYGLDSWTPLSELEELKSLTNTIPPELDLSKIKENQNSYVLRNDDLKKLNKPRPKKRNFKLIVLLIVIILIVFSISFVFYNSQQDKILYKNIVENSYESDIDFDFYVDKFYRDISVYGIFPKKPEKIIIKFAKLDQINKATNIHGISYGINNDDKIEIYINPSTWDQFNKPLRYYLMYHELSHDILNLDDLECSPINEGKLMYPAIASYESITMDDFIESSHELFEDVANQ